MDLKREIPILMQKAINSEIDLATPILKQTGTH